MIGNASADHRNSSGYILTGPEYLTMFNGLTGAAMSTVNYEPAARQRHDWGDNYGNRVDRFLAGTAYLDGQRPSLIMAPRLLHPHRHRGVGLPQRRADPALDVRLQQRRQPVRRAGQPPAVHRRRRRRRHATRSSTARMTINDNGTGRCGHHRLLAHGDALHVGDLVPSRPGQEVFKIHEQSSGASATLATPAPAQIICRGTPPAAASNGRGVAGDIYAGNPGARVLVGRGTGLATCSTPPAATSAATRQLSTSSPGGTATRSGNCSTAPTSTSTAPAATPACSPARGAHSNNGTKSTPSLSADLFGDWREEVICRTTTTPRCASTPPPPRPTDRIHTLMHDPQYRVAIAWQNTAYNQPPHPSFFLGNGMSTPPQPNIYVR